MRALARLKVTAYLDTKSPDLVAVLEERLKVDLGVLKSLPVKIPGKYEVLLWSAPAGKLNTVAKALKALDFSIIKMDNQKVVSGTRLEVDGGTTYVVYSATSGLLSLSSTTRALRG